MAEEQSQTSSQNQTPNQTPPNQNQNQTPKQNFFKKYGYYIGLVAVIAIIFGIYSANSENPGNDEENAEQQSEEEQLTDNENRGESSDDDGSGILGLGNGNDNGSNPSGNVTARGILQESDNPSRGNLMLVSDGTKIYIATVRDFSARLGEELTLIAEGTLQSFRFIGFEEAGPVADDSAIGGPAEEEQDIRGEEITEQTVTISGALHESDTPSRGNYMILAPEGKIFLQSVHDYSDLLGSEIELTAVGTIFSFTQAIVRAK